MIELLYFRSGINLECYLNSQHRESVGHPRFCRQIKVCMFGLLGFNLMNFVASGEAHLILDYARCIMCILDSKLTRTMAVRNLVS